MDDSNQLYAKDTITRLVELFQANFGDSYTYFEASPNVPPVKEDYPIIIFDKMHTKATIGPTSTDDVPEVIMITVGINKAVDAGSQNVRTTTKRHLEHIVEGQDPVTNDYRSDTILYILRTYLTLLQQNGSIWLIDSDVDIKYDQLPQKDAPTIAYADITLSTQRRVIVPGRT